MIYLNFLPNGADKGLNISKEGDMYLDPGNISYLLQFLIAGFFGVVVCCKHLRQWIKGIFRWNENSHMDEQK